MRSLVSNLMECWKLYSGFECDSRQHSGEWNIWKSKCPHSDADDWSWAGLFGHLYLRHRSWNTSLGQTPVLSNHEGLTISARYWGWWCPWIIGAFYSRSSIVFLLMLMLYIGEALGSYGYWVDHNTEIALAGRWMTGAFGWLHLQHFIDGK